MLTSERLFSVSIAATAILDLASAVVRVVVVVRLLHTFVADAYHVNGLMALVLCHFVSFGISKI
jgi:hypothetical protein